MCIAQTEAKHVGTGLTRPGNPKFGDILTVVDEKYFESVKRTFYVFAEYARDDFFEAKFFVPVDEVPDDSNESKEVDKEYTKQLQPR